MTPWQTGPSSSGGTPKGVPGFCVPWGGQDVAYHTPSRWQLHSWTLQLACRYLGALRAIPGSSSYCHSWDSVHRKLSLQEFTFQMQRCSQITQQQKHRWIFRATFEWKRCSSWKLKVQGNKREILLHCSGYLDVFAIVFWGVLFVCVCKEKKNKN